MKVKVDQTKCIGCGVCVDISEKVFVLENGVSTPIESADLSSPEILESVKMAIEVCPVQAISIEK
jgi:ferredoxin